MNLRMLRVKKRLTQQEVAKSIGVSQDTISNYERNSRVPKKRNLVKLAEFYGVTEEEITEESS
ncbi:helix-turn-helix transcriptional regulator [Cytobacillus pseudoceanisediminis]|uniref:helix-turn-helix domain-containing protein n=1 Tax=Cytobacillus pseudoceanisediminis TaxID=3051614 RepID=UPI00218AA76E|nr:helix-turn-helix transcriptional regulator [Cytobacillus pseudoceanisediminis]UQX56126.1 helix-turn-helix transcriptional regulator [Cytobacillus pseudoceanisediminis]